MGTLFYYTLTKNETASPLRGRRPSLFTFSDLEKFIILITSSNNYFA